MVSIREVWHTSIERASLLRQRAWGRGLPRPQWSIQRAVLMSALLVLAATIIWNCEGNAWVFCCGTVTVGQLVGAAAGVPFQRISRGALGGSMLGLLFFAYAAIT